MTDAQEVKKEAAHWSSFSENTAVTGVRLLYFLFRAGGRGLFWASLWPVLIIYWLMLPQVRQSSHDYLEHAYRSGILSRKPSTFTTLRHLFRFADTMLDKLLAVAGHFTEKDLHVVGREALFADKRGGVLVTAHTGCLELCQVISEKRDVRKLHILTYTLMSRRFMRILTRLNPAIELSHIEVTALTPATLVMLSEKVDAGDYLVIVGDRTPIASGAVSKAAFLGETAAFPNGFAMLATLLQCPLWAMICRRETETNARYRMTIEKLWEPKPVARKERSAHLDRLAGRFAQVLENNLKASPWDWFNFFDFWHQGAGREKKS